MQRETPPDNSGAPSVSSGRFQQMLDAYGGNQDRWPSEERRAARALVEASAEARAARDRAACLDSILDLAPTEQASPDLATRILVTAPDGPTKAGTVLPFLKRRSARRGPLAPPRRRCTRDYVAPLLVFAAAAATLLMLRTQQTPLLQSPQLVIAELAGYTTPIDVLLEEPAVDLFGGLPSFGCTEGDLGCPEFDLPNVRSKSDRTTRRQV